MTLSREEESAHREYTSFSQRNTYLQTSGCHRISVTLFLLKIWTTYWGVRSLSKICKYNSTMNLQLFICNADKIFLRAMILQVSSNQNLKYILLFRRQSNPSSQKRPTTLLLKGIPLKNKKVVHFPPHKPLITDQPPSRHLAMVRSGNNANNTRGPQRSMATAKMMKDVVIVIVTAGQ